MCSFSVGAMDNGNLPSLNGLSHSGFTTLHRSTDNDVGVSGKPKTFTKYFYSGMLGVWVFVMQWPNQK